MKCVACLQGFTWECRFEGECDFESVSLPTIPVDPEQAAGFGVQVSRLASDPDPESFKTYKHDSVLVDQQSTGRKRAAKMYPLAENDPCEWQGKKNCGGGSTPIVGCIQGLQQARHHGPDKNTLNNEQGNVHRICHTCHNRWHTLNDEGYVPGAIHPLHAPEEATAFDAGMNEVFWSTRKTTKPEH